MTRTVLILALALGLAACARLPLLGDSGLFRANGLRGSAAEVEGIRFRSRLATTTADGRGFVVATRGAGRNVPAAMEAARLRAVEHCLTGFGESAIAWILSPDRPVEEVALDADGSLGIAGTCVAR